jgi:hypothetical protein
LREAIQITHHRKSFYKKEIDDISMSFIDFSELIKSHKGVSTSDRQDCGNVIGEREDSVIVERDVMNEHIYVIPKSKIQGYDGARLILNVSEADLKSFEEKRDDNRKSSSDSGESSGIMSAISGTIDKIKDTTMGVKDKVVDTSKDVVGKTKDTVTPGSSASGQDRQFEEGYAGTDIGRSEDPLTEYRDKEGMTPAKIKEHEPTAVHRDPSDQKITEEGQTGTDTEQANEQLRKRGMTKIDSTTTDTSGSDTSGSDTSGSATTTTETTTVKPS